MDAVICSSINLNSWVCKRPSAHDEASDDSNETHVALYTFVLVLSLLLSLLFGGWTDCRKGSVRYAMLAISCRRTYADKIQDANLSMSPDQLMLESEKIEAAMIMGVEDDSESSR